jgi:putative ABC transport system ATP-binding protein
MTMGRALRADEGDPERAPESGGSGAKTLLSFDRVGRRFPPNTAALTDATFDISIGDSVAIVGPSGSGKSTLLAILGLLDNPTSGKYTLFEQGIQGLADRERTRLRREHIGFVFQAFHLVAHLTALENVEYALRISGLSSDQIRSLALAAIQDVGLAHRADAFPATMSGGEQQRVAIARAVARRPALLLCDEPTGNLDTTNSAKILDLLVRSNRGDSALVIVTHDNAVARRCARQLHVRDGIVTESKNFGALSETAGATPGAS